MKKSANKFFISIITFALIIAILFVAVSVLSTSVYADKSLSDMVKDNYNLLLEIDNNNYYRCRMVQDQIDEIKKKIDELEPTVNITNDTFIYAIINKEASKPKKADSKEQSKKVTDVLKGLNKELPGLITSIKNGSFCKDYLENGDKTLSIFSTVAGMCGPEGQAVAAAIDLSFSIYKAIMGGQEAASENELMEDRLTQQLEDIKSSLANVENSVKELSAQLTDSTQEIINAIPAASDRQDDKNRLEKFWKSYDGNFSYPDFYNYIYGSTKRNSNISSAYYALLQSALRNGGSNELVKRRYDDLFFAVDKDIKMFEDQIVSGNDVKSIVKTYYDFISSNKEWLEKNQNTTPEMAAIEFAKGLYQTLQTADDVLAVCYTYFYMQALLEQENEESAPEYFDYMGRFVFSFNDKECDSFYDSIDAREENVRKQFASDLAEILIGSNYLVEDKGIFYGSSTGSVTKGQVVYLYAIPDSICKWFDIDPLEYKYVTDDGRTLEQNSILTYNYFTVTDSSKNIKLLYNKDTVLTFEFLTNSNEFTGGAGTKEDPYLVSTKEQFLRIRDELDKHYCLPKHYCLTRDIIFDNADTTFLPFGLSNNSDTITPFNGSLDGNGFSIKNLKIGQKGERYTGLFAKIGETGIVENLTFDQVTVNSGYDNITKNEVEFLAGIVTGMNSGIIRKCSIKNSRVSYTVTNTTAERSFSVFVGGVTGKNAGTGTVSACQLFGVEVTATSSHSFGGNAVDNNKQFVYAGGIAGYNTGKIGFSSFVKQDNTGKVMATATSTLSPKANVSPYVTAFSGGICGKVDEQKLASHSLSDFMTCLYSDVPTTGEANIVFSSNYEKGYSNRKENFSYNREVDVLKDLPDVIPKWAQWVVFGPWAMLTNSIIVNNQRDSALEKLKEFKDDNENYCYIPVYYGDYGDKITNNVIESVKAVSADAVASEIASVKKKNYEIEISGLPSGTMPASTWQFDFSNLSAAVSENGISIAVEAASVISVYGFEPFNKNKLSEKPMNVVFLIDVALQNGEHIIHKETRKITLSENKKESIELAFSFGTVSWMQTNQNIIPEEYNMPFTLASLEGRSGANVVYQYTATTETEAFDYAKLSDPVIICKHYLMDKNGEQTFDDDGNAVFDKTFVTTDGSFYTDELGLFEATISCRYGEENITIVLDYEVYCPHFIWETETLILTDHQEANCISAGYDEYTCELCKGTIKRNFTQATNIHVYDLEGYKKATCYSTGNTGFGKCRYCGQEIGKAEAEEIPQLAHDYSVIIYESINGEPIYAKGNNKYYSDEACTEELAEPSFKLNKSGNKTSRYHLCTHSENGSYHTEPHQYQVGISVNDIGNLVYNYYCECGYRYNVEDKNQITPEYLNLPVIAVSQGYALNGGDEVVVYVQLLNNPGIYGANFGIRYDERLILKDFEDGVVIKGSPVSDYKSVSCGYNFVWANADERTLSGNIVKLVFAVPEDVKTGDAFPIKVVFDIDFDCCDMENNKMIATKDWGNIENKIQGGLAIKNNTSRYTKTVIAITEEGSITIVDQLPGDINRDCSVDILDAMELAKFLVGKLDLTPDERYDFLKRANVNLVDGMMPDLSDVVTILQVLTGGHGVNLLPQNFKVKLDYNGVDPTTLLNEETLPTSLDVSLYDENNIYQLPILQREGYHFDGWYTRMSDVAAQCERVESGQHVKYDPEQRVQTLYAHWTKNTVTFNGNGATNDPYGNLMANWSYGEDVPDVKYKQEYKLQFKDGTSSVNLISGDSNFGSTDPQSWASYVVRWEARNEEGNVIRTYTDLSQVAEHMIKPDFGGHLTLYAIWQTPALSAPNWSHYGYQENITWQYELNGGTYSLSDSENNFSDVIKKLGLKDNPQKVGVLTAKFTPISYTLCFDGNGGAGSATETISLEKATDILCCPTNYIRVGYEYSPEDWGWSPKGEKLGAFDYKNVINYAIKNKKIDSNNKIVIYVQWTEIWNEILQFISNNDGTCYVVLNEELDSTLLSTLIIPSSSPLGETVTGIGSEAFTDCKSLSSVTIPKSVVKIGDNAFKNCSSLTSISISNGVTRIGDYAFSGCTSLPSVSIPVSVTEIGRGSFTKCSGLATVYYTGNIADWCNISFNYSDLLSYASHFYIANKLVNNLTIPSSVTRIENCAFYGYSGLSSVIISDSVTSIGKSAFENCRNLTSLTIPNSVNIISSYSFRGCSGLESVTIPSMLISSNSFENCSRLTSVIFTDSVHFIRNNAFSGCTNLISVTIGNSVSSIDDEAFKDCYKLIEVINKSSLNISTGNTDNGLVGYYAKNICSTESGKKLHTDANGYAIYVDGNYVSLIGYTGTETELVLPSGITEIYQYAFNERGSLTSVTIPNTVTNVCDSAFSGCNNLDFVYYTGDVAGWCNISGLSNTFCWVSTDYYPYKSPLDRTLYIGNKKVEGSLTIPESVTSIESYAFYGCNDLTSVFIPDSVTSIGVKAFAQCSGLTSVTISNTLTRIENYTFDGCSSLTSVIIPNSVTSIGDYAFDYCSKLSSVIIGNSVNNIGSDAFYGCKELTSLTIPSSVTKIGGGAFTSSGLESVYYTGDIAGWCAISGLDAINNRYSSRITIYIDNKKIEGDIIIPDSVTSISEYAFIYCSGLTSVTIGNSVTKIGGNAFYNCSGLTSVTMTDSVTYIGDSAFSSCSNLTHVELSNNLQTIYKNAFSNCSSLDDESSQAINEAISQHGTEQGSGCLITGTLITLADGTLKKVEDVISGDLLLTWDFSTGTYGYAPVVFNDSEVEEEYTVIYVSFSDGTKIGIVTEHGFFDMDLGKYVYLDEGAEQYIGHHFVTQYGKVVVLEDITLRKELVAVYSPVTYKNLCYYSNSMLSAPGGIEGLLNPFAVDVDSMIYDQELLQMDIELYGLLNYEEVLDIIPEVLFDSFNGEYLNILIGKGYISWETIYELMERYLPLCAN